MAGTHKRMARLVVLPLLAGALFALAPTASAGAAGGIAGARPIMGTAVRSSLLDTNAPYTNLLLKHYKMITPESEATWKVIHPGPTTYNFAPMDKIMAFAAAHNLKVQGLSLVDWQTPAWLTDGNYTRSQLITIMQNHIRTVMGRYKGRIAIWNVGNEILLVGSKNVFRQRIGADYLDIAYRTARAADPAAKLYYNDIGGEFVSDNQTATVALVKGFQTRKVPIDGIGIQMHTTPKKIPPGAPTLGATYSRPLAGKVGKTFKLYGKLGLDVSITEMDVRIHGVPTAKLLKDQAKVYSQMLKVCSKMKNCGSFTTWGFTDKYSWVPTWTSGFEGSALPFDANLKAKPAAVALFG